MDFAETSEHLAVRDSVMSIASKYGHDYFRAKARDRKSASELWAELTEAGFTAANLPVEVGGPGGGLYDLMIVAEELAAAGLPLMTLVVSPAVCGEILARHGSAQIRDSWLRSMAAEGARMAFAMTEPDAGSNAHAISTTARRAEDGWHLNGQKHLISCVDDASSVLTVARTGTHATGQAQLSLFVVNAQSDRLHRSPIDTQVLATERQFLLDYDDVVVADDQLVGQEHQGLSQLFAGLNPERVMSAAVCCGIGRYALAKAVHYAGEREVWGQPIGAHQAVAHPLAQAHVDLEGARLLTRNAAWLHDTGSPTAAAAANSAKLAAARAASSCLDAAIQTHGGLGLTDEYGLATLWGLTRLYEIAPVTRELGLSFIAQRELGLPRSY
jgi:alkylation response protein AidB-like acyl-CoA dehydrogenase